MIKTEQLPGLWIASVPEGEVLSGVGARAPAPHAGSTFKTKNPIKRSSEREPADSLRKKQYMR
jgi:hypothetical protein